MQILMFDEFCALPSPVVYQELPAVGSGAAAEIGTLSIRGDVTFVDGLATSFVCVRATPDVVMVLAADFSWGLEWPASTYRDGPDTPSFNTKRRFLVWDARGIDCLRAMLGSPEDFFRATNSTRLAVD